MLWSVIVSAVRMAAAMHGSAEFFAPLIETRPFKGLPPRMRNFSTTERLKEKSQNRESELANGLAGFFAIITARLMKRLPNEEWLLNPKPGTAAAAAREFGIDLSLTLANLRLSPEERIRRLDKARAMINEVREAGRRARSRRRSPKST